MKHLVLVHVLLLLSFLHRLKMLLLLLWVVIKPRTIVDGVTGMMSEFLELLLLLLLLLLLMLRVCGRSHDLVMSLLLLHRCLISLGVLVVITRD